MLLADERRASAEKQPLIFRFFPSAAKNSCFFLLLWLRHDATLTAADVVVGEKSDCATTTQQYYSTWTLCTARRYYTVLLLHVQYVPVHRIHVDPRSRDQKRESDKRAKSLLALASLLPPTFLKIKNEQLMNVNSWFGL